MLRAVIPSYKIVKDEERVEEKIVEELENYLNVILIAENVTEFRPPDRFLYRFTRFVPRS